MAHRTCRKAAADGSGRARLSERTGWEIIWAIRVAHHCGDNRGIVHRAPLTERARGVEFSYGLGVQIVAVTILNSGHVCILTFPVRNVDGDSVYVARTSGFAKGYVVWIGQE